MSNPSLYQQYPIIEQPLVDEAGRITPPWNLLLQTLWAKLGGATVPTSASAVTSSPGGPVTAPGGGTVVTTTGTGGAEQILVVGASPWEFAATISGQLVVGSGQVEFRRGAGAYRLASLVGGSFGLRAGDAVRLTYYQAPPLAYYYPDS